MFIFTGPREQQAGPPGKALISEETGGTGGAKTNKGGHGSSGQGRTGTFSSSRLSLCCLGQSFPPTATWPLLHG